MSLEVDRQNQTPMSREYSVSVFRGGRGRTKAQWQKIGQVRGTTTTCVDQKTRLPGDLQLLRSHEGRVLNALVIAEESILNESRLNCVQTKDEKEVLSSYRVDTMHFRRGTVYIVVQVSNQGIRLLAYGTNKIHHPAACFWTSPLDSLTQGELEDRMSGAIKNLKEHTHIPKTICELLQAGFVTFHC